MLNHLVIVARTEREHEMTDPESLETTSTAQGCGILFAILIFIVLILVALASTWLAGSISNSSLPNTDKFWLTVISAGCWAACLGWLVLIVRVMRKSGQGFR
jgi:hypothetical protein